MKTYSIQDIEEDLKKRPKIKSVISFLNELYCKNVGSEEYYEAIRKHNDKQHTSDTSSHNQYIKFIRNLGQPYQSLPEDSDKQHFSDTSSHKCYIDFASKSGEPDKSSPQHNIDTEYITPKKRKNQKPYGIVFLKSLSIYMAVQKTANEIKLFEDTEEITPEESITVGLERVVDKMIEEDDSRSLSIIYEKIYELIESEEEVDEADEIKEKIDKYMESIKRMIC